jgi:hypothetical protein
VEYLRAHHHGASPRSSLAARCRLTQSHVEQPAIRLQPATRPFVTTLSLLFGWSAPRPPHSLPSTPHHRSRSQTPLSQVNILWLAAPVLTLVWVAHRLQAQHQAAHKSG